MELGKSRKTISAIIKSRKDRNVIEREGSDRNGIWIIKQMTLNRVQKSKKVPASIMNVKASKNLENTTFSRFFTFRKVSVKSPFWAEF